MPDRSEQATDVLERDLRDHKRMRDVSGVFYRVERLSPGAKPYDDGVRVGQRSRRNHAEAIARQVSIRYPDDQVFVWRFERRWWGGHARQKVATYQGGRRR